MKLTVNGKEEEYNGIGGFFLGLFIYLWVCLVVFWTFLVTSVVLIGTALLLLSPFILLGLVIAWLT